MASSRHNWIVVQPATSDEKKAPPSVSRLLAKVKKGAPNKRLSSSKAKKGKKSKGGGKKGKSGKSGRRLADVNASNVSLQDAADFFKVVWTYGKYALGALNTEMKEIYSAVFNGVVGGTFVNQCFAIVQGVDYNQRLGDSVKVANVRMEYLISANATALTNFTRIIVVRDFMNQGALFALGDLLQDVSTNALAITSPYLHSLGDRFEILYDMVHSQVYASDNSIVHERRAFGIGDHVLWKGPTAAIGDTWQGHMFIVVISDQATNAAKLQLTLLTQFVDD